MCSDGAAAAASAYSQLRRSRIARASFAAPSGQPVTCGVFSLVARPRTESHACPCRCLVGLPSSDDATSLCDPETHCSHRSLHVNTGSPCYLDARCAQGFKQVRVRGLVEVEFEGLGVCVCVCVSQHVCCSTWRRCRQASERIHHFVPSCGHGGRAVEATAAAGGAAADIRSRNRRPPACRGRPRSRFESFNLQRKRWLRTATTRSLDFYLWPRGPRGCVDSSRVGEGSPPPKLCQVATHILRRHMRLCRLPARC